MWKKDERDSFLLTSVKDSQMRHGSQCRSENYRTSRPVIVGVRYPSPLIPSVRTSTIHRLFLILCPRTEGRLEECHVN